MMVQKCEGVSSGLLSRLTERLAEKVGRLGLTLYGFDPSGATLEGGGSGTKFCAAICSASKLCETECRRAASRSSAEGRNVQAQAACGCTLLAVPIKEHEAPVGSVVVGVPTVDMIKEEHFARTCDRLELNRRTMLRYAEKEFRYKRENIGDVLRLLLMVVREEWEAARSHERHPADSFSASGLSHTLNSENCLQFLRKINTVEASCHRMKPYFENICAQIVDALQIEFAIAYVSGKRNENHETVLVSTKKNHEGLESKKELLRQWISSESYRGRDILVGQQVTGEFSQILGTPIRDMAAGVLRVDQQVVGFLAGVNWRGGEIDGFDTSLIRTVSDQAAAFLARSRMYAELQNLLMGILHSLTESIDAKDPYTCGHSRRVAMLSRLLAEDLEFSETRIRQIYLSGLLHDIGKIGIPGAILCKPGKLTKEEFQVIQKHPLLGTKILRPIRCMSPLAAGVLTHHERPDGTGYPKGLKKGEIPTAGLIVGVSDALDAMTSDRVYRPAFSFSKVVEEIKRGAGKQFDRRLVEVILSWDMDNIFHELRTPDQSNRDMYQDASISQSLLLNMLDLKTQSEEILEEELIPDEPSAAERSVGLSLPASAFENEPQFPGACPFPEKL
jgi:HD-GYP domain-containing protein (c-di-GMP phosphodiesterase class II)